MRAVVLDERGRPHVDDVPDPDGAGDALRVLACGLCGSDVEKIGPSAAGLVLGHEVVAADAEGRRLALVHHLPCGACDRCRAGRESTCEAFRAATILPGGFAERVVAAAGGTPLPDDVDDVRGTYAEPLACVLRAAERMPRGETLVVGGGFVGHLFAAVLRARGESVHVLDREPVRSDGEPTGRFRSVVVTAPNALADALAHVEPGGDVLAFAEPGAVDLARVYRDEITVVGSRSATPRHLAQAVELLRALPLPDPVVLPLERFDEGLDLYRERRALKVVFTP